MYRSSNVPCRVRWLDKLSLFFQEMLRRWEQMVAEHQVYDEAALQCQEWQKDVQDRLHSCTSTEGDKFALQNRLGKLQVNQKSYSHIVKLIMCSQPISEEKYKIHFLALSNRVLYMKARC